MDPTLNAPLQRTHDAYQRRWLEKKTNSCVLRFGPGMREVRPSVILLSLTGYLELLVTKSYFQIMKYGNSILTFKSNSCGLFKRQLQSQEKGVRVSCRQRHPMRRSRARERYQWSHPHHSRSRDRIQEFY